MMKKLSSLINKVEMFEKLAVYGSRSVYLQTLAQAPNLDEALNQFNDSIHSWLSGSGRSVGIPASLRGAVQVLSTALQTGTSDVKTVQKIYSAAVALSDSSSLNGLAKSEWDSLVAPAASAVAAASSAGSDELHPKTIDMGETPATVPSFPKRLQRKLNDILVDPVTKMSLISYLAEDGLLGPSTKKALDKFRAIFTPLPAGTPLSTVTNVLDRYIPGSSKPAVDVAKLNGDNATDSEESWLNRSPSVNVPELNRISPLPKI